MSEYTYEKPHRLSEEVSIGDLYNTVRGKAQDFGIEGYQVSKKPDLMVVHELTIAKAKKRDMYYNLSRRSHEPSPFSYSPSHEKIKKEFWTPHNGKFDKAKRKTYIDEVLKVRRSIPGPGDYLSEGKLPLKKKSSQFGFIGKSEPPGFLGNAMALAEESPSPSHYYASEDARKKAFTMREEKLPVFRYYSPKKAGEKEKDIVGPGYLSGLESSFFKEGGKTKSPVMVFPKSKAPRVLSERAVADKAIPGVGTYKNVDLAYSSGIVKERSKSVLISKSELKRFTERAAREKQWIPGPGSYNYLQPISKLSK